MIQMMIGKLHLILLMERFVTRTILYKEQIYYINNKTFDNVFFFFLVYEHFFSIKIYLYILYIFRYAL